MSRLGRPTRLAAALTVGWLALACDAPPPEPDSRTAQDVLEADAERRAAQVAADPEALVAAADAQVAPVVVEAVTRLQICTRT